MADGREDWEEIGGAWEDAGMRVADAGTRVVI